MNNPFATKRPFGHAQKNRSAKEEEGCTIAVKRDKSGKPREIKFSGKCQKGEIEVAKQQLGITDAQ